MIRPTTRVALRLPLAAFAVLVLLVGCAAPELERSGGEREMELEPVSAERASVTIEVKAALLREPAIDAAAIQVSLEGDAVLLEGFVADEAEATRAVALAREAAPGRDVISELVVP